MKHQMFVIYDAKANAYMQPWFLTTTAMAQRAFGDCVNSEDHNFARHPEDYTLFCIGNWDDATTKVEWKSPESMGNGIQYIEPEAPENQLDFIQQQQDLENRKNKLNRDPITDRMAELTSEDELK